MRDPAGKSRSGSPTDPQRSQRPYDPATAVTQQAPGGIAHEMGELHRLLVESVSDYAIFALDPMGYIISWNAGAERFKGYTADEIIGKHFSIFYPPERIAEHFPEFELKEATRVGRFEDEGWRVRKDGTRFWANVVITALHDQSGQLVGFAKVTRDLSARREAEESLRESEERFRLLVQGVKDYAIFMLDPGGYITTWNDGAQRINGYTSDEILGRHFSIFYPEKDLQNGKPARELVIATEEGVYEEEGWRIRKDGKQFWASVVITAVRNATGELSGFAKVTRDLTERRAAEERALEDARRVAAEEAAREAAESNRARTERLHALTAALAGAYTLPKIADVVLNTELPSPSAARALGLLDESGTTIRLIGDTGFEKLPERFRRLAADDHLPMSETIRTGTPVICRSRAERDRRFPKLAEILAPYDALVVLPLSAHERTIGALSLHFSSGADLTDASLEFLLSLAQQAAQALERAMLYEAEQKARARADEANRAKSEFLAAMSHELRTPLNAIGGYAELMAMGLRGPVTSEQHEDLQRIRRSQQHLLGIINDILNFSRIEAGQTQFELGLVVLSEALDSVGQMIAPQAAARGLRFELTPCPPDVAAWADRSKVDQILLNLLSNAVKFTWKGSVSVRCTWDQGPDVSIVVSDTGIGIPTEQTERIFEPFVQVGRSLTSTGEGTGLGLAISRDLARGMNGDVRVESTVGRGSTFTLVLPRATQEQVDAPRPSQD